MGPSPRQQAGWHVCLEFLGYQLAGETPPWSNMECREQVHPGYVERLGAEASTIGPP